jgi:enterochelin esterase-like enzyme
MTSSPALTAAALASPSPASVLDTSLILGTLPTIITLAGALSLAYLLMVRRSRWWTHTIPTLLIGSVLVVGLADVALLAWRPFPDPLPTLVLCWAALPIFAAALAVARAAHAGTAVARARHATTGLLAFILVTTLSTVQINAFYGYRPTLRTAIGLPATGETDFAAVDAAKPTLDINPRSPLSSSWTPPPDLPVTGAVTHVPILGTVSQFAARPAWVYLPPAYLVSPRPLLPLLVLIAGQPGDPHDWITAGQLARVLNAFAAAHGGLAPIVIVPDATGSPLANPLCLDSKLGNAEAYLTVDVPNWARTHLQIDRDTGHWAIGGFSYGGTCALQLSLHRPDLYPTFLDISGQQEPTLGSHLSTVRSAYGGDEQRFRSVNPLDILAHTQFPHNFGILAVGTEDHEYRPQARRIERATRAAGIATALLLFPGGHSWIIATEALQSALPTLSERANLISKTPPTTASR